MNNPNTTFHFYLVVFVSFLLTINLSAQSNNAVHAKVYDEQGNITSQTSQFLNGFGQAIQTQVNNFTNNQIIISRQISDSHGRPALQTLPAPALTNNSRSYISQFVLDPSGNIYGAFNFSNSKINSPDPLGSNTPSTLGWYYSNTNTLETHTPSSGFPFSSVAFYPDPLQRIKKTAGPGEHHRMGSNHEGRIYYMDTGGELSYLYGNHNSHFANHLQKPLAYKTVFVNADGVEFISFTDENGLNIASCYSGTSQNNCIPQQVSKSIKMGGYVDIHLPATAKASLKLPFTPPSRFWNPSDPSEVPEAQLVKYTITNLDDFKTLAEGSDFTIDRSTKQVIFGNGYQNGSGFFRISFRYNQQFVERINGYYATSYFPPDIFKDQQITYELDYSNWSINYYDEAGRLIKSIPPEGIDCSSFNPALGYNLTANNQFIELYDETNNVFPFAANLPFQLHSETTQAAAVNLDHRIKYTISPQVGGYPQLTPTECEDIQNGIVVISNGNYNPSQDEGKAKDPPDQFNKTKPSRIDSERANNDGLNPSPKTETPECLVYCPDATYCWPVGGDDAIYENSYAKLTGLCAEEGFLPGLLEKKPLVPVAGTSQVWCGECSTSSLPCNIEIPQLFATYKLDIKVYAQKASGATIRVDGAPNAPAQQLIAKLMFRECACRLEWEANTFQQIVGSIENDVLDDIAAISADPITQIHYKISGVAVKTAYTFETFNPNDWKHQYLRFLDLKITTEEETYPEYAPTTPIHSMEETFAYNALGWITSSNSPDEGKTEFVYNDLGELRFYQNAEQKKQKHFSYLHYDPKGRVQETGEFRPPGGNNSIGQMIAFQNYEKQPSLNTNETSIHQIINRADGLDDNFCHERSRFTYDLADSNFPSSGVATNYQQRFLLGKLAKVESDKQISWYSYDELGRLEWELIELGGLNGFHTIDYTYDLHGNIITTIWDQYQPNQQFIHRYEYDADKRLEKVYTQAGNDPEMLQAKYHYYAHGPLKRVELAENLQGIDYTYTIDGSLKSINHPSLNKRGTRGEILDPGKDGFVASAQAFAPDIFGMAIDYHQEDYKRQGTFINYGTANTNSIYDGRISAIRWQKRSTSSLASLGANEQWMYAYQYNDKDWLKTATFGTYQPDHSSVNIPAGYPTQVNNNASVFTATDDYKVWGNNNEINYDLNGNITSLFRNGVAYSSGDNNGGNSSRKARSNTRLKRSSSITRDMDEFTFHYPTNNQGERINNQLSYVADANDNTRPKVFDDIKNQSSNNYRYNSLGQLIYDASLDNRYTYNHNGLVTGIYKSVVGGSRPIQADLNKPKAKYFYNASGQRIRKEIYHPANFTISKQIWYVRDVSGQIINIYENKGGQITSLDRPIYGAGRIGLFKPASKQYLYALTDHLGNTRAVVEKQKKLAYQTSFELNGVDDSYWTTKNIVKDAKARSGAGVVKIAGGDYRGPSITVPVSINQKVRIRSWIKVEPIPIKGQSKSTGFYLILRDANGSVIPNGGTFLPFNSPKKTWVAFNQEFTVTKGIGNMSLEIFLISQPINGQALLNPPPTWLDDMSVQLVPTANGQGGITSARIVQQADYYPFGMPMPQRSKINQDQYRFGYQGQEKDEETGYDAFELRLYDGRIARWFGSDPMGQHFSPYLAMGNNPVQRVDLDGGQDEEEIIELNEFEVIGYRDKPNEGRDIDEFDSNTTRFDDFSFLDELEGKYNDDTFRDVIIPDNLKLMEQRMPIAFKNYNNASKINQLNNYYVEQLTLINNPQSNLISDKVSQLRPDKKNARNAKEQKLLKNSTGPFFKQLTMSDLIKQRNAIVKIRQQLLFIKGQENAYVLLDFAALAMGVPPGASLSELYSGQTILGQLNWSIYQVEEEIKYYDKKIETYYDNF